MKRSENGKFRTHVKEPRWQQVASLAVVVFLALLWLVSFIASR